MPAKKKSTEIDILTLEKGRVTFCILGMTPMICHRVSVKAQHELLLPGKKKNAAEKASSLKHNPYEEFRAAAYTLPDDKSPTLIAQPAIMFKAAIRSAALDIPGATKTQVGRLTYVNGEYIPVYGIPKLHMGIVRNSDINRTPDVRTRLILPRWACQIDVTFIKPMFTQTAVANLLAAAGLINGIGDFRPQKGAGTYGQFEIVNPDNAEFKAIIKEGGRDAQVAGMTKAEPYDGETADLLSWFDDEVQRRGLKVAG